MLPRRGVFGHRDGRSSAADALCRAPLARSTRPASTTASSKSGDFGRPERLASTTGASPPAFAGRGGRSVADACNLDDPRARAGSPEPRSTRSRFPSGRASRVAAPLSRPGQLGFLGSGARPDFHRAAHPPVAIARTEVGYPDPRDPDTFCRRRVTRTAGGAALAGCTTRTPFTHPPHEPAFARPAAGHPAFAGPSGRVASHGFPRRKSCSTKPKVPSVVGLPPGGRCRPVARTSPIHPGEVVCCPQVVPSLWTTRRRLFNPCSRVRIRQT